MCLLVILHRQLTDYPLIVLANRDEDARRAAEPPSVWPAGIVAPRDAQAGGTWIGVNRHGVLAAVTNREDGKRLERPKSRGHLAPEVLKAEDAFEARRRTEGIQKIFFNPFNLLFGDRSDLYIMEYGDNPAHLTIRLRPGLHVLSNIHPLNSGNAVAVRDFIAAGELTAPAVIERMQKLAARREPLLDETHVICKDSGERRTVSSCVIALHASDAKQNVWLYHEGPPSQNRWSDVSALIQWSK